MSSYAKAAGPKLILNVKMSTGSDNDNDNDNDNESPTCEKVTYSAWVQSCPLKMTQL